MLENYIFENYIFVYPAQITFFNYVFPCDIST